MDRPTVVFELATGEMGVKEMLRGAASALLEAGRPIQLHLVGYDAEQIRLAAEAQLLPAASRTGTEVAFHEAKHRLPERIESPVKAYRAYPDNPISVGLKLASENGAVFISPGNTGLVVTGAMFIMGRLPGIERPPIITPLPTLRRSIFYLDAGAHVDVRAQHLLQFAHIGKVYLERIFDRVNPRIGLLSNGTEDYKGNALVREAHHLLSEDSALNFVGYIEGQDIFAGDVDLMICDGFIGNILLKSAEGLATTIYRILRQEMTANPLYALAARMFLGPSIARLKRRLDYSEWGGAPLLGIRGNVVICHGRSNANAIKNAIRWSLRMVEADISAVIEQEVSATGVTNDANSDR